MGRMDDMREILASAPAILGLEVTVPAIAAYCNLGNLDHHSPESTASSPTACEQALSVNLPPPGALLLTVYPDADSVTGMAILANRESGDPVDPEIVQLVANYDKYGPSMGRPADLLIAVSRIASSNSMAMTDKVEWIRRALRGEVDEQQVAGFVEDHDRDFLEAQAATTVALRLDGKVAIVESKHRYATKIGYMYAKVLICVNPEFPVNFKNDSDGTYRKYTICRFNQYVPFDLPKALVDLLSLESGWGGRADIVGSPIGSSSVLTLEQVLSVVEKHLN